LTGAALSSIVTVINRQSLIRHQAKIISSPASRFAFGARVE